MQPVAYTRSGVVAAIVASGFIGLMIGTALGAGTLPNLKEWQTLIGAAIAVLAAWIAWTNVRTTIRVNLMSREEDMIREELPGLRDAVEYLQNLASDLRSYSREKVLAESNLTHAVGRSKPPRRRTTHLMEDTLAKELPRTDNQTRHQIVRLLQRLARSSQARRSACRF